MKKPMGFATALLVILFTAGYDQPRREHGGRGFGGGYIPSIFLRPCSRGQFSPCQLLPYLTATRQ